MPTKKSAKAEDVVRKKFPKFDVVKGSGKSPGKSPGKKDAFQPPDSTTPDVKTLHKKYKSDSAAEEESIAHAAPASDPNATSAVVIEPKEKGDAPAKRLTVLVKQGKVRAVQG
jgi:hypothetical protein